MSAQKQQAVDYFSAHATMPLASFEPDEPVESLVEEAVQTIVVDRLLRTFSQGQLDKRRLGICVGSYGFELMSGGSRAQVEEHAARSLAYAKLHGLELVFAVHFIVQRATTRQQPVTFPTWPAIPKADEQVSPVRPCSLQLLTKQSVHNTFHVRIPLASREKICSNLFQLAFEKPELHSHCRSFLWMCLWRKNRSR